MASEAVLRRIDKAFRVEALVSSSEGRFVVTNKAMRKRSRWLRGSTCEVLLFCAGFPSEKPLSQIHGSTFQPLSGSLIPVHSANSGLRSTGPAGCP